MKLLCKVFGFIFMGFAALDGADNVILANINVFNFFVHCDEWKRFLTRLIIADS